MKILRITSSYYPAFRLGGSVSADLMLDKALCGNGCTVEVYTTYSGTKNKSTPNFERLQCISIYRFVNYGSQNKGISIGIFFKMVKNIKKFDIVIISGIWNLSSILGSFFCRVRGVKYVITTHGALYPETMFVRSSLAKRIIFFLFVKNNILKSHKVHVTTQHEFDCIQHYLSDKEKQKMILPFPVDSINHGVTQSEIDKFKVDHNIKTSDKVLLFIGRIDWKKGLDVLLEAFNQISYESTSNMILLCVGPDPDGFFETIIDLVDARLLSNVKRIDFVEGRDKEIVYKVSNLFILSSYSENYGMTVVESMFYGLPVIISENVGMSTLVNKYNAGRVIKNTKEEVSKNVLQCIDDKKLLDKYKSQASKLIDAEINISIVGRKAVNFFK